MDFGSVHDRTDRIAGKERAAARIGMRARCATPSGDPIRAALRVAFSEPTDGVAALDRRTTMARAPLLAVGSLQAIMDVPKVHNSL